MKQKDKIYICIDFDGTIVKHEYPEIGEPVPHAIESLKYLQEQGYLLILNTMRSNTMSAGNLESLPRDRNYLQEALDFLDQNGIEFYGINQNPDQDWSDSRKIYAHFYIDDAALGCPLSLEYGQRPYVDWVEISNILDERIHIRNGRFP